MKEAENSPMPPQSVAFSLRNMADINEHMPWGLSSHKRWCRKEY
jgi:hypothetical protein